MRAHRHAHDRLTTAVPTHRSNAHPLHRSAHTPRELLQPQHRPATSTTGPHTQQTKHARTQSHSSQTTFPSRSRQLHARRMRPQLRQPPVAASFLANTLTRSRQTPHHATQRHATPRHATPHHPHATPRHATPHHPYATPHRATLPSLHVTFTPHHSSLALTAALP